MDIINDRINTSRNVDSSIILLLEFHMLIYYYTCISSFEIEAGMFIDGALDCKTQRKIEVYTVKECYINSKQLQNFKKLE